MALSSSAANGTRLGRDCAMQEQNPRDRARFLRPHGLCGVEALHATFVKHRYAPHVHDAWTIAQVRAGAARFKLEAHWHTAPAGSVFVIPPGAVHTGESATPDGYDYRVLYLEPAVIAAWVGEAPQASGGRPRAVVTRDVDISRALRAAHAALLVSQARLEQDECIVAVARLLHDFARRSSTGSEPVRRSHAAVQSARVYIEDRWNDDFTLGELASVVGMSPFHLLRTFGDQVGMTPSAYRRGLRVEAARRLLRSGVPCAQAALDCGFYDQAHLNRHFKRVVGVTPGQYAAAVRN